MIAEISVLSSDSEILGNHTVTLVAEAGVLRVREHPCVPVIVKGIGVSLLAYIPDLYYTAACSGAIRRPIEAW